MVKRRRFKQSVPLHDRLAYFANEMRDKASLLPPGREKDDLLNRASRADTASQIDDWANSLGLQPPK
jgi:hypothetical protein